MRIKSIEQWPGLRNRVSEITSFQDGVFARETRFLSGASYLIVIPYRHFLGLKNLEIPRLYGKSHRPALSR